MVPAIIRPNVPMHMRSSFQALRSLRPNHLSHLEALRAPYFVSRRDHFTLITDLLLRF